MAMDQLCLEQCPGGPDEGWPKWCQDQAGDSTCVLIVASEGWFAAFEKTQSAGIGLGAAAEADIVRQRLYNDQGINSDIRLVFLHDISSETIPLALQQWHHFSPFATASDLDGLTKWAANRLQLQDIQSPKIIWPEPYKFTPEIADRNKTEWPAIVDLLAGRSKERILFFEGESGLGKSELLRQIRTYANHLQIPVANIDFKGGMLNIDGILGTVDLEFGSLLPDFSQAGANKSHLLRKNLRSLQRPVLMMFDTYEAVAENEPLIEWLNQQILAEVPTSPAISVIISGTRVPKIHSGWGDYARLLPLERITDTAHWQDWLLKKYPNIKYPNIKDEITTLVDATNGQPSLMALLCDALAKKRPEA
jgi:hypothetical protein